MVDGLIDSGAGICLLPDDLPRRIFLPPLGRASFGGVVGPGTVTPAYYPTLTLANWTRTFAGIKFGTWSRDYALLGRNLLNQLYLALDGPNFAFQMR
jgi:hypothetical protein